MSGHTRGLIHVDRDEDEARGVALSIAGSFIADVGPLGNPDTEDEANAARLALCWNALASLDNETVERLAAYLEQHNNDTVADMLREEGF